MPNALNVHRILPPLWSAPEMLTTAAFRLWWTWQSIHQTDILASSSFIRCGNRVFKTVVTQHVVWNDIRQ